MTNVDSQRIREIRDNTKAMAEAFSSIANTLANALELFIATQTETQNSNLTFKTLEYCDICDHKGCEECITNALDEHCMPSQFNKQIEDECAKEYEELGLKELKELIKADRKTEPTISKMEQVDKDINVRSKDEPQTDGYISGEDFMKIFDEPQTDCDHKCIQTEIGCEKPDCPWK